MKLLVTGGAGFIGSNFINYILRKHADWEMVNLDKLTYAGNLENLEEIEGHPHYLFIKADIADREQIDAILSQGFDTVVNFAAESHVDRSIMDASPFIETNIRGTQVLLEGVKKYGIAKYVQVSTDEVYGSCNTGYSCESSPLCPSSPYAASKTSADLICGAYFKTFKLPVMITRCSNNYGPFQFPEKLIPLVISNAVEKKEIPVYGDGLYIRDWIHVTDHCRALETVILKGQAGQIYNVGTDNGKTNIDIVKLILEITEAPSSLIKYVADRPGHDRRYALEAAKIKRELGWQPSISFEDGLRQTVRWYLENESWWRRIKSGEYAQYYQRMYAGR